MYPVMSLWSKLSAAPEHRLRLLRLDPAGPRLGPAVFLVIRTIVVDIRISIGHPRPLVIRTRANIRPDNIIVPSLFVVAESLGRSRPDRVEVLPCPMLIRTFYVS